MNDWHGNKILTVREVKWLRNQKKSMILLHNIIRYLNDGLIQLPESDKTMHDFEFINLCQEADHNKEQK